MASQFPGQQIQYTDVSPSGRIAAVPAQMPATGGLEAVGGALFNLGQKIDAQESAVELSQGQRQIEEKGFALVNSVTADPKANEAAWAKYQKDVEGVIGGMRHGNAQRALQIHANEHLPQWQQTFKTRELTVRSANAAAQMKFEATALLGRGDVGGAATILQNARDTNAITQAEYDYKMSNIFTDSALEMANVDIREGRAAKAVESLTTLKDLSGDQLELRDKYLRIAQQTLKRDTDALQTEILFDMESKKNATPSEKANLAQQYRIRLSTSDISPERAGVMIDRVNKWETGQDNVTNPQMKAALTTQMLGLWAHSGDIKYAKQNIQNNAGLLSAEDYTGLIKLADEKIEAVQANALSKLEANIDDKDSVYYYPGIKPEFQTAMLAWLSKNKEATPLDILKKGRELILNWQEKEPEDIFGEITQESAKVKAGTILDRDTAAKILGNVGGDKDKARQRAKELGYEF